MHGDPQDGRILAAGFARGGYLGIDGHLGVNPVNARGARGGRGVQRRGRRGGHRCASCRVSQPAVFSPGPEFTQQAGGARGGRTW